MFTATTAKADRDDRADRTSNLVRAEAVLARLQSTRDPAERRRLSDEVVLLTIGLADDVARRFAHRGLDSDDVRQVARVGLIKAVRHFRTGRGSGFAAYAVPTIAGEIKRHFRDVGWLVRPPRRLQELRVDVVLEEEQLRNRLGREPSVIEVASSLGRDPREVRAGRDCSAAFHGRSLDELVDSPAGLPGEVDPAEAVVSHYALLRALTDLSDRDRLILRLRFVEEWTQSRIGMELGVSQMQVSRLLNRILARLRMELVDQSETGNGADGWPGPTR